MLMSAAAGKYMKRAAVIVIIVELLSHPPSVSVRQSDRGFLMIEISLTVVETPEAKQSTRRKLLEIR